MIITKGGRHGSSPPPVRLPPRGPRGLPLAGREGRRPGALRRGDSNIDRRVDIADAIFALNHLFFGQESRCLDAADFDGNGEIEVTDAIGLLGYAFQGGTAPPPPFPDCGLAPSGTPSLGCDAYSCDEPVWYGGSDGCRQCEPCTIPSLEMVVASLEAAGLKALDSRMTSSAVVFVCGAPRGRSYFVLIDPEDLSKVQRIFPQWDTVVSP